MLVKARAVLGPESSWDEAMLVGARAVIEPESC